MESFPNMNRQTLTDRIVTYSDPSPPDSVAQEGELVSRFRRIACGIRLALIWTFGLIVVAGSDAATLDSLSEMVSG